MRETTAWRRIVAVMVALVMALGTYLGLLAASARSVDFTVNHRERVCSANHDGATECKYLVYTTAGVFEDTDTLLALKTNSSDLYNQLQPGKSFTAHVIGWGITWPVTRYPNITSVEESE